MELDYLDMAFIKGASDGFEEAGVDHDAAEDSANILYKIARSSSIDEEDESWWDKYKGWVYGALATIGAFHLGGMIGRGGRPDRSLMTNLFSAISKAKNKVSAPPGFKPSFGAKYGPSDYAENTSENKEEYGLPLGHGGNSFDGN